MSEVSKAGLIEPLQLGADDVEIVDQQRVYKGFAAVDQYRLKHRLLAGGWSDELGRECLRRPAAVAVLLYDPQQDAVVLIEQFRIGAYAAKLSDKSMPWMLEVVAGLVEPGESNEEVARREVAEESGLVVSALKPIYSYYVSPGTSDEVLHLFCGCVDASEAGGIHGVPGEHEDIAVHVFGRAEAWQALVDGVIVNATAIMALQWLQANAESLRAEWR